MKDKNSMTLTFSSSSVNEAFARTAVVAFLLPLDPTVSEITDIKTAVSEAVTNAIIHGYENSFGDISLMCSYEGRDVYIEISDRCHRSYKMYRQIRHVLRCKIFNLCGSDDYG